MQEYITINKPLPIRTTTNGLKDWLIEYYRSKHDSEPSVWDSQYGKDITVNYHAPTDGRIIFTLHAYVNGDLTIVSFSYPVTWKEYAEILIEAVRSKFETSPSFEDFSILVSDKELAKVLQNRLAESRRAFEAEAYLSVIILLGSILEAVLFDKARQHPRQVNTSIAAPKNNSGNILPLENWSFENLIGVAQEQGWLDNRIPESARELMRYRNLIHARQQVKESLYPNDGTCKISEAIVLASLKDIIRWSTKNET